MKFFTAHRKAAVCFLALFAAAAVSGAGNAPVCAAGPDFQATRPTPVVQPFTVYLSPSAQPWNPYCDGSGSEESHMRPVAEAVSRSLEPYGIRSVIGAPHTGARSRQRSEIEARVKQARAAGCNLYLAIHSNAKDGGPKTAGTTIFYPSGSAPSLRFADILKKDFIYPDKNAIGTATKDELWEMYMPPMPHCLIEVAYHDNPQDVRWIESHTEEIGRSLARGIAEYAYIPVQARMDRDSLCIRQGELQDLTAQVTLIDGEVLGNAARWTSSNSSVAAVKNGTIFGAGKGTAEITAWTGNGIFTACRVTVL